MWNFSYGICNYVNCKNFICWVNTLNDNAMTQRYVLFYLRIDKKVIGKYKIKNYIKRELVNWKSSQSQDFKMKVFLILPLIINYVQGHARLLEPPSRASMWRVGFDNPADYDDNGGNCGGFNVSWNHFQC